ncbi:unnamed protein product [Malus baccata var. baccata]
MVGYKWWQCGKGNDNGGESGGESGNGSGVVVALMMMVKVGGGSIDSERFWMQLTYWGGGSDGGSNKGIVGCHGG